MAYTSRTSKGKPLSIAELDNNFMCHYPIGSIYLNAMDDRSPHELIGYGSWEPYAQGLVLLSSSAPKDPDGLGTDAGFGDSPDKIFNVGNATIGSTLQNSPDYYSPGFVGGLPSVNMNNTKVGTSLPEHRHEWAATYESEGSKYNVDGRYRMRAPYKKYYANTSTALSDPLSTVIRRNTSATYFSDFAGGNEQHNNIQPYITVNMWVRKK